MLGNSWLKSPQAISLFMKRRPLLAKHTRLFWKWALRSVALALSLVPTAQAQTCRATASAEPENHGIVVERLRRYHDSGECEREIREAANEARDYLESKVREDREKEKFAAVFDIDETSLSNWDAMNDCGFCSYSVRSKYYPMDHDEAITPVLELFDYAKAHGIAVFFVTGRPETQRQVTIENLHAVGYSGWTDLIMQPNVKPGETEPPAHVFKPKDRQMIADRGYRIVLNIGDQASDLS